MSRFGAAIKKHKEQLKNQAKRCRHGRSIRIVLTVLVLILVVPGILSSAAAQENEIKVQYNGNNIVFTDASPKIINDRTMVPFRQILETMGAVVTYEPNAQLITAQTSDRTFNFAIGTSQINITKNGQTIIKQMDVVPYLDPETDRTYVPARFMAESLDYSVGWDDPAKTAVIIDFKAIFANADRDFSLIAKLLNTGIDPQKAYATTGDFDLSLLIYAPTAPKEDFNVSLNGDFSGRQQGNDLDLLINLSINTEQILSVMPADEQAQLKPMLDRLQNAQIKMKMDGKAGVIYVNTNLASLIDPRFNDNTWFRQDFKAMYEEMDLDYQTIMGLNSAELTLSELLTAIFMSGSDSVNLDTESFQEISAIYAFMQNLIGDKAFDLQTTNGIKTGTLMLDQTALFDALTKAAVTAGASATDLSELKQDWPDDFDFQVKLVIAEQGGALKNYTLEGTTAIEGINIAFSMAGNQQDQQLKFTVQKNGVMQMATGMNLSLKETNQQPDLKLPAGAQVVDADDF